MERQREDDAVMVAFRWLRRRPRSEGEAALEIDGTTKVAGSAFASAQLPQVRVFNRDFINATLSQTGGIAPIYFLGEDSIEKQARVEQLKKELTTTDINRGLLRPTRQERSRSWTISAGTRRSSSRSC